MSETSDLRRQDTLATPDGVEITEIGSIGARIRHARKKLGLNQADLAIRLGVSQPTVANWESGVHDPRQLMLARIAEALELKMSWLASGQRSSAEKDKHPAAAYLRRGLLHCPVITVTDAMKLADGVPHDLHDMAIDYLPVTSRNNTVFALFAQDDAMSLMFPGNTLVVIDYSHRNPADGEVVLLRRPDGSPLLRRWRQDPPRLEPYSTDPGHETIYIDRLDGVIGTVSVSIRFY